MAKEKKEHLNEEKDRPRELTTRRIEEARKHARFRSNFTLGEQDIQIKSSNGKSKKNYLIPILCVCAFISALIGWWIYSSPMCEKKHSEKEAQKHFNIVEQENIQATPLAQEEPCSEDVVNSVSPYSSDSLSIIVHPAGCTNSITMIKVKGGVFLMGSNDGYNNKPKHQVELSDFYIADKEVTQALWTEVMGSNGSDFAKRLQSPQKPADNISWQDAQDFIKVLNILTDLHFRLPTEAEWEFAAKGGNKSCGYVYSGSDNINQVAWWAANAYNVKPLGPDYGTHYVGMKSPNELGLYDMSGNVWEWCQDWYTDYPRKKQKNPTGPATGYAKVVRGGCFTSAGSCKTISRDYMLPDNPHFVGIRLVLSAFRNDI